MVGAVTTLIVIVAVFLAYNANNGLPFVPGLPRLGRDPRRRPADQQQRGPDRRPPGRRRRVDRRRSRTEQTSTAQTEGGDADAGDTGGVGREGQPEARQERRAAPGTRSSAFATARRSASSTSRSSAARAIRRPRATSSTAPTTAAAARCPPIRRRPSRSTTRRPPRTAASSRRPSSTTSRTRSTRKTRANARTNLAGFGDAFAGRGTSLNDAIERLEPLFSGPAAGHAGAARARHPLRPLLPGARRATAAIVAPVADQQADLFTKGAITFAAISSDPQALEETISEGVADPRDRDRRAAAPAPVPDDFATLGAALQPGRQRPARDAARAQRRDRGRHAGPAPLAGDQPPPRGRPAGRSTSSSASRRRGSPLQRLQETFDTAEPLAQVRRPGADGLQLLELLVHLPAERPLRPRPGRLLVPPGRSARHVPALGDADAPVDAATPALQANGTATPDAASSSRTSSRSSTPTRTRPAGQQNADCQGGQSGYAARAGPACPASRRATRRYACRRTCPARAARRRSSTTTTDQRELVDTRIPSASPETWKKVADEAPSGPRQPPAELG